MGSKLGVTGREKEATTFPVQMAISSNVLFGSAACPGGRKEAEGRAVKRAVGPQGRGDVQTGARWGETSRAIPQMDGLPAPTRKSANHWLSIFGPHSRSCSQAHCVGARFVPNRQPCMHLLWREDPGSSEIHAVTSEGAEG